jgi:hypothetical protein
MAALAAIVPTRAGALSAGAAVAASDTISVNALGYLGAYLEIINGNASPDTVAISDASVTPSGAAATAVGTAVANGTSRVFKVTKEMADPVTGNVTVTHTVTSTVTYKLYPIG